MRTTCRTIRHQLGVSYVEVLTAAIIIALTAIPAAEAIRGAIVGTEIDRQETVNQYRLKSRLEEVLAESFDSLSAQAAGPTTASSYSDAGGTLDRRLVFISTYDGDNADADNNPFTGTDADLLWVRVEIEGSASALQALKVD